jgi:hypothetical protein
MYTAASHSFSFAHSVDPQAQTVCQSAAPGFSIIRAAAANQRSSSNPPAAARCQTTTARQQQLQQEDPTAHQHHRASLLAAIPARLNKRDCVAETLITAQSLRTK